MKIKQSLKSVVLPLKNNIKKSLFHDNDLSGEDSDLKSDDVTRKVLPPETKKFTRNGNKNTVKDLENHERKQASSPYSPNACGKLISCMEKLEKLSRRLERIPDNDQSRQPKSLFKPFRLNQTQQLSDANFSTKYQLNCTNLNEINGFSDDGIDPWDQTGNKNDHSKLPVGSNCDGYAQPYCQEYEAFGSDGSSSGYSSAGSPAILPENQPLSFVYYQQQRSTEGNGMENIYFSSAGSTSSVEETDLYQSYGWFNILQGPQMEQIPPSPVYNTAHLSYYPQSGAFSHQFATQPDHNLIETNQQRLEGTGQERSAFRHYRSFRYRNGERTAIPLGGVTCGYKNHEFDSLADGENLTPLDAANLSLHVESDEGMDVATPTKPTPSASLSEQPIYEFPSGHIERSCMCSDCILARMSCQLTPAENSVYY